MERKRAGEVRAEVEGGCVSCDTFLLGTLQVCGTEERREQGRERRKEREREKGGSEVGME